MDFSGIAIAEVPGFGAAGYGASILPGAVSLRYLDLELATRQHGPDCLASGLRAEIAALLESQFCGGVLRGIPGSHIKGCCFSPSSRLVRRRGLL